MQIFLSSKADRQLSKLPVKMHAVITSRIENLANPPFGSQSKKLKDRKGWRLRVGDYRILYTVEKNNLVILSVSHRKDAYRIK